MAVYGSRSNPVTTLSNVSFGANTTNTVYCYINQTTTFSNCSLVSGIPTLGVKSQSNVTNVSFTSGANFTLSFTLTASTGQIALQAVQGISGTFNLIGVQLPDLEGSGTQADPYTKIADVGFEWLDAQPSTIYIAAGATIAIRDDSLEIASTDPALPVYGLSYDSSLGYYALHGTVAAHNNNSLLIELHDIEEDIAWISTEIIFVAPGPTLNVKVNDVWKDGIPFVKVNGAWKEATKVYVKVNGAWKESM